MAESLREKDPPKFHTKYHRVPRYVGSRRQYIHRRDELAMIARGNILLDYAQRLNIVTKQMQHSWPGLPFLSISWHLSLGSNFKAQTTNTKDFSECFNNKLPILDQINNWRKVFSKHCRNAFKKVRVTNRRRGNQIPSELSNLINSRN